MAPLAALAELAEALSELADALSELADALSELAEALVALADALALPEPLELAALELPPDEQPTSTNAASANAAATAAMNLILFISFPFPSRRASAVPYGSPARLALALYHGKAMESIPHRRTNDPNHPRGET